MISVEQVYRESRQGLIRAIRPRCHTRHDAEDALHEAIERLLTARMAIVPALLYTTMSRIEIDKRKHYAVTYRLNHMIRLTPDDMTQSPEDWLREFQLSALFEQALGYLVLNEEQLAESFLLRTQLELQWDEIGRRMGVSTRMAQIYVSRAVECLREYVHA